MCDFLRVAGKRAIADTHRGDFRKSRLKSIHQLCLELAVHAITGIGLLYVAGHVCVKQDRIGDAIGVLTETLNRDVNVKTDVLVDDAERYGVSCTKTVAHHFFDVKEIDALIFAGIAAGLPSSIGGLLELVRTGAMSILAAIFIEIVVGLVTYFVVFVERGQRKILVNYARRQVGNKVYGGQSSHLPLKLNMAGVIPPIFASSIILLPATIVNWFSAGESMRWLRDISAALTPGQPVYVMFYAAAIIFFCFFYTALVFNSRETADNLKKSGAFIPGIRPGEHTARYIDKILVRVTLAGAVYIIFVCLLPAFLILKYNVPFYFGGTSLLIIVVVTMDFMAQVQNYMMSQQYESLLKKANFKTTLGT